MASMDPTSSDSATNEGGASFMELQQDLKNLFTSFQASTNTTGQAPWSPTTKRTSPSLTSSTLDLSEFDSLLADMPIVDEILELIGEKQPTPPETPPEKPQPVTITPPEIATPDIFPPLSPLPDPNIEPTQNFEETSGRRRSTATRGHPNPLVIPPKVVNLQEPLPSPSPNLLAIDAPIIYNPKVKKSETVDTFDIFEQIQSNMNRVQEPIAMISPRHESPHHGRLQSPQPVRAESPQPGRSPSPQMLFDLSPSTSPAPQKIADAKVSPPLTPSPTATPAEVPSPTQPSKPITNDKGEILIEVDWPTHFDSFEECLLDERYGLVNSIASNLPITEANRVCAAIVTVFHRHNHATEMIKAVIEFEVNNQKTSSTLFRNNSIATYMMTCFTKLIGVGFLQNILAPVILELTEDPNILDYEIDPTKVDPENLAKNAKNLKSLIHKFFDRILNSRSLIPKPFLEICNCLQRSTIERFPESKYFVIGGFLFLRYLCPAIVAPDGHKLGKATVISTDVRRVLVLVGKVLQTIANERDFNDKEDYMYCMNQLVQEYRGVLQYFFNQLAKPTHPDLPENTPTVVITDEEYQAAIALIVKQVKVIAPKMLANPNITQMPEVEAVLTSLETISLFTTKEVEFAPKPSELAEFDAYIQSVEQNNGVAPVLAPKQNIRSAKRISVWKKPDFVPITNTQSSSLPDSFL